jgi:hypothetical protein
MSCASNETKPALQSQRKKEQKLLPVESPQTNMAVLERVKPQVVQGVKRQTPIEARS